MKRRLTLLRRRAEARFRTSRSASIGARSAAARLPRPSPDGATLLVGPPGAGNIGDQAMVEAFLQGTEGPVVLVVRTATDIDVPVEHLDRVHVVPLPHLIYGTGAEYRRDRAAYLALVREAARVAVVGADMLDGTYTVVGSVRRTLTAELAALAGRPTRVLGFSWNAEHKRPALVALAAAAAAGVELVVRDPVSYSRLVRAGVANPVAGADVVFTASGVEPVEIEGLDRSRPYAVLNVSALIARRVPAVYYEGVIAQLQAYGLQVVLLPHVLRGTSDDLAACVQVAMLAPERTVLVDRRLTPSQIRAVAADARLVITGRMHLAILALTVGVPAITFSSQGKVQGMLASLGVPHLCVEPGPGLAARVRPVVDEVLGSERTAVTIRENLAAMRALAERNLASAPDRAEVPA